MMTIISPGKPFASLRRNIHTHAHRRKTSNNSSSTSSITATVGSSATGANSPSTTAAVPEKDTTSTAAANKHGADETMPKSTSPAQPLRPGVEQQMKAAKEIWSRTQPLIRNDWQWPDPPSNNPSPRFASEGAAGSGSISACMIDTSRPYTERSISLPDGSSLDLSTTADRKRKREVRSHVRAEILWNQGLRTFEKRRKAWTGAVDVFLPEGQTLDHENVIQLREKTGEMLSELRRQSESEDGLEMQVDGHDAMDDTRPLEVDATGHELGTTLLPFYVSTIPQTFSISRPLPSVAAEKVLYKKLVVDGKTAIAPIPLANVVKACVTGLQDADAWPPKAGTIDPLAGKVNKEKRRSRIKSLFGMKRGEEMDGMVGILHEPGAVMADAGFET